jgi:hypothetical protein
MRREGGEKTEGKRPGVKRQTGGTEAQRYIRRQKMDRHKEKRISLTFLHSEDLQLNMYSYRKKWSLFPQFLFNR